MRIDKIDLTLRILNKQSIKLVLLSVFIFAFIFIATAITFGIFMAIVPKWLLYDNLEFIFLFIILSFVLNFLFSFLQTLLDLRMIYLKKNNFKNLFTQSEYIISWLPTLFYLILLFKRN